MTVTMTTDEAEDIVYGDHVAMQHVSAHRWYDRMLVVFEIDGEGLHGFYYLRPKTEMQEGQDIFESDPVSFFPVVSRQVATTVYAEA